MDFQELLTRDAMLARYMLSSCVYPSVRPSVCPSVTSRCSAKTAEHMNHANNVIRYPKDSSFWRQNYRRNSKGVTQRGRQI